MKKILLSTVLVALLISACSGTETAEVETPVVLQEVQVSTGEGEVVGGPAAEVQEPPAVAESPGADQPSEEAEETTAVAEAPNASQPAATDTPYPTLRAEPLHLHPEQSDGQDEAYTPLSTMAPTRTPAATAAATATQVVPSVETPAEAPTPPPVQATSPSASSAPTGSTVELARIEDTDPGPPFTILVSTIRIEEDGKYKVTGTVRNDGSEIYGGTGVIATFYEEEKPCYERKVSGPPGKGQPSDETVTVCDPNWFGPVKVYAACTLLEPGAECPFSLEIYARDYVAYHLHPEGTPVEYRQPASLVLSGVNVSNDGIGNVRITGTATNENAFAVRDVNIAGTLLDAGGQIVSLGSTRVLGNIEPGASAAFDLRIEYKPYAHYELFVQGIQN